MDSPNPCFQTYLALSLERWLTHYYLKFIEPTLRPTSLAPETAHAEATCLSSSVITFFEKLFVFINLCPWES